MISRTARLGAFMALFGATGCGGESALVVTVKGDAPEAKSLVVRLIGAAGPVGPGHVTTAPQGESLGFPAVITVRPPAGERMLGVVVWAADATGTPIARAATETCVSTGADSSRDLMLAGPDGWSPRAVDGCRCDPKMPDAPMCSDDPRPVDKVDGGAAPVRPADAGGSMNAGGSGGGGGGAAGQGGGSGGMAGRAGGSGGSGGMAGSPAGGMDAAAPADPPVGGSTGGGSPGALFGFEKEGDWTSTETMVMRDTMATQGQASLAFTPNGRVYIRSRAFDTKELAGATARLSLDVHVSQMQPSNGNIQLWFECVSANVHNGYIQYKGLGELTPGKWSSIKFDLPPPIAAALAAQHSGCKIWMEHHGMGLTRYDKLTFVP